MQDIKAASRKRKNINDTLIKKKRHKFHLISIFGKPILNNSQVSID